MCSANAAGTKFRNTFSAELRRYAALVKEAAEAELESHAELTVHQEFLGAAHLHLEQTQTLQIGRAITRRLIGKQSVTKQQEDATARNELFEILLICALAAWLEQTERWYDMPLNPRRNLPMVCNHHAMQTRCMAAHVRHEHKLSSQSMFTRVCANCGRLLYSRGEHSHLPREVGVSGKACQLRGRVTDWFAMPPFLLLWSKKALGKFLRAVMSYDESSNQLRLNNGRVRAPWLHLQQHFTEVQEDSPWMYCIDCHDYMVPTVREPGGVKVPKRKTRIPMRNRQEALYTRWHRDLGFPHLRESLLTVFPALQGQLPTTAEVLEFQKTRQQWVQALRRCQDQGQNSEKDFAVNFLHDKMQTLELQWASPPHERPEMDRSPCLLYTSPSPRDLSTSRMPSSA